MASCDKGGMVRAAFSPCPRWYLHVPGLLSGGGIITGAMAKRETHPVANDDRQPPSRGTATKTNDGQPSRCSSSCRARSPGRTSCTHWRPSASLRRNSTVLSGSSNPCRWTPTDSRHCTDYTNSVAEHQPGFGMVPLPHTKSRCHGPVSPSYLSSRSSFGPLVGNPGYPYAWAECYPGGYIRVVGRSFEGSPSNRSPSSCSESNRIAPDFSCVGV